MKEVTKIDLIIEKTILPFIPKQVTPNQITMLRLLVTPVVIWLLLQENYFYGGILFTLAMITDAIDGALARTQNKITDWGKIMDPIADKFLMGSAAVIMIAQFSNMYLLYIIIVMEVLFVIGGFYQKFLLKRDVEAESYGKWKTVFQSFGLGFLILFAFTLNQNILVLAESLIYVSIPFGLASLLIHKGI